MAIRRRENEGEEIVYIDKKNNPVKIFYEFRTVSSTGICKCLETKNLFQFVLVRVHRVVQKKNGTDVILSKSSREANMAKNKLKENFSRPFCNNCLIPKQGQAFG